MSEKLLVIRRKRRGNADKFERTGVSVDWGKVVGLSGWGEGSLGVCGH